MELAPDGFRRALDPCHSPRARGEEQREPPHAAVEIENALAPAGQRELPGPRVKRLGLLGVDLEEGGSGDVVADAAEQLSHTLAPRQEPILLAL